MNVLVVGSLNVDYIAAVDRLPRPGQTLSATGLVQRFGGKGANQAMAAARQGGRVSMVGCVGADDAGCAYRRRLEAEGIDASGVTNTSKALTGTALIAVDRTAENMIVVAAGANGYLSPAHVRAQRGRLASAGVMLLQFEVPIAAVIEAVRLANRARVPVVLNPSPLKEGFPWGKCVLDTLIVNAGEAATIFGLPAGQLPGTLSRWQRALQRRGVGHLIITRGAKPTLWISADGFRAVPTLSVKPVDTVGAGDAFAGAFAACLAEGLDTLTAIRYANCVGALATLKAGAQEAIPKQAAARQALRCLPTG